MSAISSMSMLATLLPMMLTLSFKKCFTRICILVCIFVYHLLSLDVTLTLSKLLLKFFVCLFVWYKQRTLSLTIMHNALLQLQINLLPHTNINLHIKNYVYSYTVTIKTHFCLRGYLY